MPRLRLLTPVAEEDPHPGIDAFTDEILDKLDWRDELDYWPPLWSNNDDQTLQNNATAAKGANADVLVADGSRATDLLLQGNPNIPVIQAVGGKNYNDPGPAPANLTGFHIDALATAKQQLASLPTQRVTVLYDHYNPPSQPLYDDLATWNNLAGPHKNLIPLDIHDLDTFAANQIDGSFMLIPNAMFFNNAAIIAREVRTNLRNHGNAHAVYPEREYKKAHGHGKKQRAHVIGHHITFTFRQAAHLANKILLAQPVPAFGEADTDIGR